MNKSFQTFFFEILTPHCVVLAYLRDTSFRNYIPKSCAHCGHYIYIYIMLFVVPAGYPPVASSHTTPNKSQPSPLCPQCLRHFPPAPSLVSRTQRSYSVLIRLQVCTHSPATAGNARRLLFRGHSGERPTLQPARTTSRTPQYYRAKLSQHNRGYTIKTQ